MRLRGGRGERSEDVSDRVERSGFGKKMMANEIKSRTLSLGAARLSLSRKRERGKACRKRYINESASRAMPSRLRRQAGRRRQPPRVTMSASAR